MRRVIAGLLTTLTLAGVVFAGSALVAPPAAAADPWGNDWEDGLKQLEVEYGVTRQQCDDDWLGLKYSQCSVIDRYRYYDTANGAQYGYTSSEAAESAKKFQQQAGLAPSPGQLVGGGAAAAGTTAAGMTAAQASAYWTGMFALTGAGLMGVVGNPPWTWNIDEATTDLVTTSGSAPGWADGSNVLHFAEMQWEFNVLNPDVFWGTPGQIQIEVKDLTGFLQGASSASQVQQRITSQTGGGSVTIAGLGIGGANVANYISWWNNGSVRTSAIMTVAPDSLDTLTVSLGSGLRLEWFPLGHELRPADVPEGMHGTLTTTLECTSSEGTQELVFNETFNGGFEMDVGGKECPPGHVLTGGRADWTTDQGTQNVWDYDAPDEIKNIPVEFDHCLTGADCGLGLWRVLSDGEVQSCGPLAIGCQNWWGHANKTDVYQCRAGGSVVDLGYCAHLREPGKISPVRGVDVTPDGRVIPQERIVSLEPEDFIHLIEVPVTVPDPQPGPGPGPGPGPQPPLPPPPPAPMPEPDVVQENRECWPSGWGVFNPFDWVYRPIQCALVWAFVPHRAVDTSALLDAFDGSILGFILGYFGSLGGAFDGLGQFSQQCGVIASTELTHLGGGDLEITTCSPIVEAIRPWMHIALSVLTIGGAVLFTINAVLAAFGLSGVLSTASASDKKDDE